MSLLIKALDKAQNAKTEQAQAEDAKTERANAKQKQAEIEKISAADADLVLSLSPSGSTIDEIKPVNTEVAPNVAIKSSSQTSATSATVSPPANLASTTSSSKSAANVFSAKGIDAKNSNKKLALIAGAGLLSLLAMGAYFYQFVDNTPDVVIPPRPLAQAPAVPQQPENNTNATLPEIPTAPVEAVVPQTFEPDETAPLAEKQEASIKKLAKEQVVKEDEAFALPENATDENTNEGNEVVVSTKANKKGGKSKTLQFGEAIATPSASISVTKTKSQPGVNPTLVSAYEDYNAGKDTEAQKLYKQVLQQDVRNVDALLGLGAIASRQGRVADADGWYAKVLEVEPRNNIAQAALLDSQPQGNEANSESRLKSMLAKQPDDANLHVALGNLYAEQNQWPAAQQAYFDAYSLHASADNAFNLAVSLDQMGKPKLALPYYQRALELAQTGSNGIDKAALEARIAAIQ